MVSCFARCSAKITGLMWTIWTLLSAVPRKAVIFNHSQTHPRYPQFSWCGRYLVLTYLNNTTFMHQRFNELTDFGVDMNKFCQKNNTGYLLLEWVEFLLEVWEKSRNYFLWTLWQPCNYIHYNVWDEVTYPSSKFKYENQVWESSLRIGRISCPNIKSEYRVPISRLNIESENWTRKRSPWSLGMDK